MGTREAEDGRPEQSSPIRAKRGMMMMMMVVVVVVSKEVIQYSKPTSTAYMGVIR